MCFLKVPEGKTAENRMLLDVGVAPSGLHARADELVGLGATFVAEFDEPQGHWTALADREGTELCLHRSARDPDDGCILSRFLEK